MQNDNLKPGHYMTLPSGHTARIIKHVGRSLTARFNNDGSFITPENGTEVTAFEVNLDHKALQARGPTNSMAAFKEKYSDIPTQVVHELSGLRVASSIDVMDEKTPSVDVTVSHPGLSWWSVSINGAGESKSFFIIPVPEKRSLLDHARKLFSCAF